MNSATLNKSTHLFMKCITEIFKYFGYKSICLHVYTCISQKLMMSEKDFVSEISIPNLD